MIMELCYVYRGDLHGSYMVEKKDYLFDQHKKEINKKHVYRIVKFHKILLSDDETF